MESLMSLFYFSINFCVYAHIIIKDHRANAGKKNYYYAEDLLEQTNINRATATWESQNQILGQWIYFSFLSFFSQRSLLHRRLLFDFHLLCKVETLRVRWCWCIFQTIKTSNPICQTFQFIFSSIFTRFLLSFDSHNFFSPLFLAARSQQENDDDEIIACNLSL